MALMALCRILILSTLCELSIGISKYIFHNVTTSSLVADQTCQYNYGTHLASIHSTEDNAAAQTLCNTQSSDDRPGCWIGLHDFHDESYSNGENFIWYDGSALDYQNWRPGEPNEWYSHHGGEDLVDILADNGQWNDELNGRELRLICWNPEYKPTFNPTMQPTSEPTVEPTVEPTSFPTMEPTIEPTNTPTVPPTNSPTHSPTAAPTARPTIDRKVIEITDVIMVVTGAAHQKGAASNIHGNFIESNSTTIVYVLAVLVASSCVILIVLCYTERSQKSKVNAGDLHEPLLVTLPSSNSEGDSVELTKPIDLIHDTLSFIVDNTESISSSEDDEDNGEIRIFCNDEKYKVGVDDEDRDSSDSESLYHYDKPKPTPQ